MAETLTETDTPEGRGEKLWGLVREAMTATRHDFTTLPLAFIIVVVGCSTMAVVASALFGRECGERVEI